MIAAYEMKRVYSETFIFARFAREIIAIARAEKFIENQLARTNAAENVKKLKINQNRRFVQKKKKLY